MHNSWRFSWRQYSNAYTCHVPRVSGLAEGLPFSVCEFKFATSYKEVLHVRFGEESQ